MEGFKILKNTNQHSAKSMPARCFKTGKDFVIRLEHDNGGWCMVYDSETDGGSVSDVKNSNDELQFDDGLHVGNDYACPHCGNKSIVRCGACKHITCHDGSKQFDCAYCDSSGEVKGKMASAYVENPSQSTKKK